MAFIYDRTIRFQDTDAAGVVYFANVLSICHEAYEAALIAAGIDLREFFSGRETAIPIVHAQVDFFKPMYCGDQITIELCPKQIDHRRFEILYQIRSGDRQISQAVTRHVCIDPQARSRISLPSKILDWLEQTSD